MPQYLNPNAIEPGSITSEMLNSEVIENIKTQVGGGPTIEYISANTPLQVYDNKIYIFEGGCTSVTLWSAEQLLVGSLIRFRTITDCSLEISDVLWANGEVPTVEDDVEYELSVTSNSNGKLLAVISSFK